MYRPDPARQATKPILSQISLKRGSKICSPWHPYDETLLLVAGLNAKDWE